MNPFFCQVIQAFLEVSVLMLGIDRGAQGFLFQLCISRAGLASVGRLPPLWAHLVATSRHLLHNQAVISIEAIGRVVKDIVDRRVLLAPAIASQGAAFPVLAQELGTREFGNQILVPQSHLLTS